MAKNGRGWHSRVVKAHAPTWAQRVGCPDEKWPVPLSMYGGASLQRRLHCQRIVVSGVRQCTVVVWHPVWQYNGGGCCCCVEEATLVGKDLWWLFQEGEWYIRHRVCPFMLSRMWRHHRKHPTWSTLDVNYPTTRFS